MKVRCLSFNQTNIGALEAEVSGAWLKPFKVYEVLSVEFVHGEMFFRVFSEQADTPTLFKSKYFEVIDRTVPKGWVLQSYDGSWALSPPDFSEQYFWENYFNGEAKAVLTLENFKTKT